MARRTGWQGPSGDGILASPTGRRAIPTRVAEPGLLVEVVGDGFAGAVVRCTDREVVLADRRGRERRFLRAPGAFLVDDRPVELVPPPAAVVPGAEEPALTPSGSVRAPATAARTARASRILVEGVHDAELLERIWGDDLRAAAIVVEPLHGADDLAAVVAAFRPGPTRRLGILLVHLVPGSKESRLAAEVAHPDVLVLGHPFVDVWAAIRPAVLGRTSWPEVPRGEPYKEGLARRLGFTDTHEAWRTLLGRVRTWTDLDRSFIHAVESLLDHVTLDDPPKTPQPR
ncbi:MAG: DUF3097 family protein [Nitriliruptoraceae bacterium]